MSDARHLVTPIESARDEADLAEQVGSFFSDPLGYVMFAWPWGEKPALRLVRLPEPWASRYDSEYGPDGWFCELLENLGAAIRKRGFNPDAPRAVAPYRAAVRSGHGIGKGAGTGMLVSFLLDTRPDAQGSITANTGAQLATKTWAAVKWWKGEAITAHWWEIRESFIRHRHHDHSDHTMLIKSRCNAMTWSKEKPEAFAGQHEASSSSFYVFDESSAIPGVIHENAEGGMATSEGFKFDFGNPTRNTGRFSQFFGKLRGTMDHVAEIDSRTVQITNKDLLQDWVDTYGLDSDFVRVRVLGKEPKQGERQLIPSDVVARAMRDLDDHRRVLSAVATDTPIVMAIDVALDPLGDEQVICVRRGPDARSFGMRCSRGLLPEQLAAAAAEWYRELRTVGMEPSVIFVDAGGLGQGVIVPLRLWGFNVIGVNFGGEADRKDLYVNKAAEMWVRVRDWLGEGGVLPDDETLATQLTSRPYSYDAVLRYALFPKDRMREELELESPDRADALALTFAFHVAPRSPEHLAGRGGHQGPAMCKLPYNPDD